MGSFYDIYDKEVPTIDIAARILELRTERGMSQYALYKKAGISQGALSEYESGKKTPGVDVLQKISSALGITLSEFFSDEVETPEPLSPDDEAWELRELLHKRPEMKTLFHASRHVKKEDIETVAKLMESFRKDEWVE